MEWYRNTWRKKTQSAPKWSRPTTFLLVLRTLYHWAKGGSWQARLFRSVRSYLLYFIGIYDSLLKWPYNYRTTFYLLDQNKDLSKRKHIMFSVKPNVCPENEPFLGRPRTNKNPSFGSGKFAAHEDIEKGEYIKDNTMFIKVVVECDGMSEPWWYDQERLVCRDKHPWISKNETWES